MRNATLTLQAETKNDKKMATVNTSKFLGADGLTATSANHIANIAKEMYEALDARISSLRLYNRDYTLALKGKTYRVENESGKDELASLEGSIREIAALKSLIAWLREGIKVKEQLASPEAEAKFMKELVREGRKDLEPRDFGDEPTFANTLALMGPDEQARYFALEAKCATLGKFIHPDGVFAEARKSFFKVAKNPTVIAGKGQDAEVNTFTTSFTAEEVDAEFFALQKRYRSLQAEFNSLKAAVDAQFDARKKQRIEERRREMEERDLARQAVLLERSREVKALKIIVPQGLKDIFDKVNSVAAAK